MLPGASCYMQQQSLFLVAITRTITLCGQKARLFCVKPTLRISKNISNYLFLNINQLDALNFIMSLFEASACFEHMCSSSGGHRLREDMSPLSICARDGHL